MLNNHYRVLVLLLLALTLSITAAFVPSVVSLPPIGWPSNDQWIWIDSDKNEDGAQDDWRDVKNAYYYYDGTYLYLRLECYAAPGSKWPADNARYKWFINTTQMLYMSGGNIIGARYLLFVEDTNNDGIGEIYLLKDIILDGKFDEYGPGQAYDYRNYKVTDPTNATFRITGNYIDMKVKWASIGNPTSYGLMWATDQENPNLNQGPTTDHPDEEIGLVVHDVVAVRQWANVTEVEQGKFVKVTVEIENRGTSSESFDVTAYFGPRVTCVKRVVNLPAGQTTTVEFDCPTEGVEPGIYVIRAFVDSAGEILEINEDNNWCTAPASVTVKVHDVAAISQEANPTIVTQGETVTISVVVKNLGNYTETFDVTVYYDSTPIGTQTVNGLAPGEQTTVSFNWNTAGVPPEIYFIKAFVDSSRAISEFNEANNNCTAITPIVIRSPAQPSISIEKAIVRVVSGPDPPIVGIQTVYEIKIIVTNTGDVPLLNINATDYIWGGVSYVSLGIPSTGTAEYRTVDGKPVIVWNITSLEPLQLATLIFNVALEPSSSGVFELNLGQDLTVTGRTSDYTYVNDVADLDVVVSAYTRDVVAISQTPLKTKVNQGELVGIDVVVKNAGDYYAETFNVTLYYSSDGTTWTKIEPIDTIRVFSLGIGEEITLRFVWDTEGVPPGTYYIRAVADSSDELPETYEENNECIEPTTIEIQVHDIVAVSQSVSATSVMPGYMVTITGLLRNDGTETETFTVRCYYGRPEIPPVQIGSDLLITLEPNEETTVSFYWDTSGVTPGTYWIEIRALPVLGELDTDDNTCTVETPVTIKAYYVGGEIVTAPVINLLNMIVVAILLIAALATTIMLLRRPMLVPKNK